MPASTLDIFNKEYVKDVVHFYHFSFGRRPLVIVTGTLQVLAGTLAAFMPDFKSFLAMRFLVGFFGYGKGHAAYVLGKFVYTLSILPSSGV